MSLSCCDRRLSIPVLNSLEGRGVGALGGRGFEEGLSCPFLITSTFSGSDPSSKLLPVITQGCSFERGSCGLTGQRDDQTYTPPPPSYSGLLQQPVCRVEDLGLVEACDRFVPSQWNPSKSISRWRPVSQFSSLFGGAAGWSPLT